MALVFDGSNDIGTETLSTSYDPKSGLTLCCRARPGALGAVNVFMMFEDTNTNTCLDVIQVFMNASNQLDMRFRKAGSASNLGNQDGTFANTTTFRPCVVTIDSSNAACYLGPSSSGHSGAHGQPSGAAVKRLVLGANTLSVGTRAAFYANTVCDVGVFPRVWSSTEINHYLDDGWSAVKIESVAANNSMILYPISASSDEGATSGMLNAACDGADLSYPSGGETASHTAGPAGLVFPSLSSGTAGRRNPAAGLGTRSGSRQARW